MADTEQDMPRVRFKEAFDWRPTHRHLVAFPKGHEGPVTRACADQAIAAGRAELIKPPEPARPEPQRDPDPDPQPEKPADPEPQKDPDA